MWTSHQALTLYILKFQSRLFDLVTTSRAWEVTLISGEGLTLDRRGPVKKNAFAVVRTNSWILRTTNGHRLGGLPTWNEKIVVDFPSQARFLIVEVHCKTFFGEKVIGTVKIPAMDIANGYFSDNYLYFLSYRLRDGKEERNVIINLSVRVKMPKNRVSAAMCGAVDGRFVGRVGLC